MFNLKTFTVFSSSCQNWLSIALPTQLTFSVRRTFQFFSHISKTGQNCFLLCNLHARKAFGFSQKAKDTACTPPCPKLERRGRARPLLTSTSGRRVDAGDDDGARDTTVRLRGQCAQCAATFQQDTNAGRLLHKPYLDFIGKAKRIWKGMAVWSGVCCVLISDF